MTKDSEHTEIDCTAVNKIHSKVAGDNIAAFCSDVLTISIFSGSRIYSRTLGVNRNTTWMECKSIPEHHAQTYSHRGSIHEDGFGWWGESKIWRVVGVYSR